MEGDVNSARGVVMATISWESARTVEPGIGSPFRAPIKTGATRAIPIAAISTIATTNGRRLSALPVIRLLSRTWRLQEWRLQA